MITRHRIILKSTDKLTGLDDNSVDLVVTSPPYPMIAMWDDIFIQQDPKIQHKMEIGDGPGAFESMHRVLDRIWKKISRMVRPGGIVCINIGDAVRTIKELFSLYPNHGRILSRMATLGFYPLPEILWRKQTNAPNKFMGSGMLPAGAYVTLEHEFILVFRKGHKREFLTPKDKTRRRESAFFWEERNIWFSDVWFDIKGARQKMTDKETRKRSGAYPFELPYRLINMYSVKGDTVLDPFLGTGTTTWAAMAAGRNSVGYERDKTLEPTLTRTPDFLVSEANQIIRERISRHHVFVKERLDAGKTFKHRNIHYDFPVVTAQEKELIINPLTGIRKRKGEFEVTYQTGITDADREFRQKPRQQKLFA